MARLGDFSWWPSSWSDQNGASFTSIDGVLRNVRRSGKELILILENNGSMIMAQVNPQNSEDFVILLRHILLQHIGEPMSVVENIDMVVGVLK